MRALGKKARKLSRKSAVDGPVPTGMVRIEGSSDTPCTRARVRRMLIIDGDVGIIVTPRRWMVWISRPGSNPGSMTSSAPDRMLAMQTPSELCAIGNAATQRSVLPMPYCSIQARPLYRKLRCDQSAPLGRPEDPEVYHRATGLSGSAKYGPASACDMSAAMAGPSTG